MKQILIGMFCFFSVFLTNAETIKYVPIPTPDVEVSLPIAPTVELKIAPRSVEERSNPYSDLVYKYAIEYSVSAVLMDKIIYCESRYNSTASNINARETSWGLVQINLKAHTTITQEEAVDPDFAIRFLAEHIAKDKHKSMWYTCSK